MIWISTQLDILCTKKKHLPLSSSDVSLFGKFLNLESFAIKNCILKRFETFIIWSVFYYIVASESQDAIHGVPDGLLKTAMVFRVHSRRIEFLLIYWCPSSMLSWILRGLCAKFARHLWISWHFRGFSKLMQRIFKYGKSLNITLTPYKQPNIYIYETPHLQEL